MKKVLMSLAAVAAVFAGCQKPELEVAPVEVKDAFTASVENFDATKTALDGNHVVWSAADQLAIFQGFGVADLYEIADASAGSSSAKFVHKTSGLGDDFFGGVEMNDPRNVAFYPYAEGLGAYSEEGAWVVTNVTLPATQVYSENSFGNGAFPMVAVTETMDDHNLRFKNVLGAVKFQFTGSAVVKSIALKGNNGEVLAGKATVTAHDGFETPSVVLAKDGATEVVLDCGEGVQLSSEATNFVVALPPVEFEKGFTATVTYTNGKTYTVEATAANEVLRSGILAMPEVELWASAEKLGDVTLATNPSMTEVALKLTIDNADATGFYGIFAPGMWVDAILPMLSDPSEFNKLINNGYIMEGFVCNLYEGTTYNGPLSEFGVPVEYLSDIKNDVGEVNYIFVIPVVKDKTEYSVDDLLVFEANPVSLTTGGTLTLPECTLTQSYVYTELSYPKSEGIVMAKYAYFGVEEDGTYTDDMGYPAEMPTEENYLEPQFYFLDARYDSEEGMTIEVRNAYNVLPGKEYKVCIILVDAKGKCSFHVVDAATLAIPYAEDFVVSVAEPEYDPITNMVDVVVNVPAGADKLYYTLNTQKSYTAYNASTFISGIILGTSEILSVDLTEENVVDGKVSLSVPVGTLNSTGARKVSVHVVAFDGDTCSNLVSSVQVETPKFEAPAEE